MTGAVGLPARTMVPAASYKNEPDHWGWNPSPTKEGWWFIGNTSSDEITGHMYGLSIFLNIGAGNAADQTIARSLLNDMMSRIIKGGLILRDVQWEHETKWGHWDPADLNGNFLVG